MANLVGLGVKVKNMVRVPTDKDRETLARFSVLLSVGGEEIVTLPNLRYAVKVDGAPKVVAPIHRKLDIEDKVTQNKAEAWPKCYFVNKALLELVLPEAEKAFGELVKRTKEASKQD